MKRECFQGFECLVFSGLFSTILLNGFSPSAYSADVTNPNPKPLHDFSKTVNPWAIGEKQLEEAKKTITTSDEYIARDPKDPSNYINRADSYVQLMKPNEALQNAVKALSLSPKNKDLLAEAYCLRGQAQIQLKQYKAAIDSLNKSIVLAPDNGEAIYFRGMAKEMLGQLPEAIKDYQSADNLGFAPHMDIDFAPYMESLQSKIKLNWHPPKGSESKKTVMIFKIARDGSMRLSKISQSSGVPAVDAAAVAALKNAQPFDPLPKGAPKAVDIRFVFDYRVHGGGIGVAWDSEESKVKKKIAAAEAKKDEAGLVVAQLDLAEIDKRRGKYPEAIELCKQLIGKLEGRPEKQLERGKAFGQLGMVYSLQGKTDEAEAQFKKSLELLDNGSGYPNDSEVVEILTEYAKVLYKAKKIDEANKIYARLKK